MTPWLQAADTPLASTHDVALLDLDGTLYVGADAVPGAAGLLAAARSAGLRVAYVTNNASSTPRDVAGRLASLGFPAAPDDVTTSAQAAARVLADRLPTGSRVLAVGGPGLTEALAAVGLTPVGTAAEQPAAVVQGWYPDLSWRLLAEGAYALAAGLPWVATNTDLTLPTPGGTAPGNGSFVALLAGVVGRRPDAVAGKPGPDVLLQSASRTGAVRPLVVGDRLDTDIEGAHAAGLPSLLVLTGVSSRADLLAARPEHRPTFVASDLRGLLEPHRRPEPAADGGWQCAGWRASIGADGLLQLTGSGRPDDGLRASCAAAWTAADRGVRVEPADLTVTDQG